MDWLKQITSYITHEKIDVNGKLYFMRQKKDQQLYSLAVHYKLYVEWRAYFVWLTIKLLPGKLYCVQKKT